MSGGDGGEKGQSGARTPQNPGAAAIEDGRAALDLGRDAVGQALAQLVQADADGDAPGLFDFDDDGDVIGRIAKQGAETRRGRGRPKGAGNLRNDKLFDALEAAGYGNPAADLVKLASADPVALATALRADKTAPTFDQVMDVLRLQVRAREALLPYQLARKPQAVEVKRSELHLFLAGDMSAGGPMAQAFDLTGGLNEINGLAVRQTDNVSHDDSQAIDNAGETPSQTDD